MPTLCLIALGCPKNIVESESMAGLLEAQGVALTTDISEADYALVHTCSFIADARGESAAMIRRLSRLKKQGRLERLFVSGCFVQSEGKDVLRQFPEIDGCIGTGELERIREFFAGDGARGARYIETPAGGLLESPAPRLLSSSLPSAYLRLSEGCGHRCSFCIIPRLRGKYRSRSMGSVVAEARALGQAGIREVNLIAQDTSCYGIDLYGRFALAGLLNKLVKVRPLRWLRLMYAYPSAVTGELMATIRGEAKICKYLDIPLQHASDRILRAMRRPAGVRKLVERLKRNIPDIALRTALIVGFPGETERDFAELSDFVSEGWFEHLGVFEYSPYPGTAAARSGAQVPDAVKRERKQRLMLLQKKMAAENNRRRIGSVYEVFVESARDDGACAGRAAFQAPEIDARILFRGTARPGSFARVRIIGARGYDMTGKQIGGDDRPDGREPLQ